MQLSPDGQWFWDGTEWRPARSPDGRWRWDGRQWVPAGPPAGQQWRYEPTEWTRRLQVIVIALAALGVLLLIVTVPAVLLPTMQQSVDRALATQPSSSGVDPAVMRSTMNTIFSVALGFAAVLGVANLVVTVLGTVRLWRWVFWYVAIAYLLAAASVPQNITAAAGLSTVSLPGWTLLVTVPLALAEGAMGVWMIVLYRRYGTWARRRVPA